METDPFADLERKVRQSLHATLGPGPYGERLTRTELEQRARQALQEILSGGMQPMTSADRARIGHEVADQLWA